MSICVVWSKDRKGKPLYAIDDIMYDNLSAYFDYLYAKTGVFIDRYADTRLTAGHARLILDFIKSKNITLSEKKSIREFINILSDAVSNEEDLFFIGD